MTLIPFEFAQQISAANVRDVIGNITASYGELIVQGGAPSTVTLPAPAPDVFVGIYVANGATGTAPVTIVTPSGRIHGLGLGSGVISVELGVVGVSVVLQSDGSDWMITSGQQDTGWVPLPLRSGCEAAIGFYVPAYRVIADRVWLRGAITNQSSIPRPRPFDAPTTIHPALQVYVPVYVNSVGGALSIVTGTVTTQPSPLDPGATLIMDGASYPLFN